MSPIFDPSLRGWNRWKRIFMVWGGIALAGLIAFLMLWNSFFSYVPPGKHLLIIAKDGQPLPPGQVLAEKGQKGVRREVLGEGWHFILPVVYTTELEDNTVIPPGKVGIVTARGGKPLSPGRLLAEEGEQGIQRRVLAPGAYRINKRGFEVEPVDAVEIKPGYVGVLRRLLGNDGKGRFAEAPDQKGIVREVLQPGIYYLNTKEFQVTKAEVGIFQTTFHYDKDPQRNTAINFTSKGGFSISLDCTIEWEVRPEDMPELIAEYGPRQAVERTVIDVQAHSIGRNKGIDYGAQDFLEGNKREKFQQDFTQELTKACKEKSVTVHSAFIRNIIIPEQYLKPIRDKQIAAEVERTNLAKQATAESEADVEREKQLIVQKKLEVEAETKRLVAALNQKVDNLLTNTQVEIEKLKAEYSNKIATLDAQRVELVGKADTDVTKLKETARSGLFQLKMDAFQNDANAFLRYSLAKEQLNEDLRLRLFHSGPGTFWTNMDGKGMNLLFPAPTATGKKEAPDKATTAPKDK